MTGDIPETQKIKWRELDKREKLGQKNRWVNLDKKKVTWENPFVDNLRPEDPISIHM